jgi:diguanylate cyclase (GGDEF)-like protein
MDTSLYLGIGVGLALAALGAIAWRRALAARRERQRSTHGRRRGDTVDALTGLPSRNVFDERATAAMEVAENAARPGCALYAGLDDFRLVNDRHGHPVGDEVLRRVATLLQQAVGEHTLICRVAGDEFAVWLDMPLDPAKDVADRIVALFKDPIVVQDHELQLGISVGIALFPDHGTRNRIMLSAATAMRAVKAAGGHAQMVYRPELAAVQREQADLVRDLRQAVENKEFELYYQPKIDSHSRQVTAAEALLRWRHPKRGMVSPDVFIPLAERHGLIASIGDWVLDEAIKQAAAWRKFGLGLRVAVNVSGYQMRQDDFAARLERGLRSHGVAADGVTCEVAETAAMEDSVVTQRAFGRLGRLGVHVSIDEFGAGQSRLTQLQRLPARELKIDRALVAELAASTAVLAVVQAIIQMAHTLKLRVVAVGVETEAQRDQLLALGCDEMQGYLFAKPMSARALGLWAMDAPSALSPAFDSSHFKPTQTLSLGAMASTEIMSTRP